MAQIPLFYGPDLDLAWSRNAGVCRYMNQLVPTTRGTYATAGSDNFFGSSTINQEPLIGYMFRQISGAVRLLMFNAETIDEYDSSATRTSRGSGYSVSTTGWSAAAFGNNIIACNYLDATQVSSGTSFGSLGGSPPKARHVTVQSNFVMFADTDDGTNQYADQVWWSAIGNSASYTPDLATQAGNIRLVGAPGPIRCLVNFRDYVVAFKDDATYLGQYVGPPSIWSWRLASNRIGCMAQHGAAELGGVLYFIHTSGIYSFDGSQFVNIGRPIMRTMLTNCGVPQSSDAPRIVLGIGATGDLRLTQVLTDDVDGTVFFAPMCSSISSAKRTVAWAYNVNSRKWGTFIPIDTSSEGTNGDQVAYVKCTNADMVSFIAPSNNTPRFLYAAKVGSTVTARCALYPASTALMASARIQTGSIGSTEQSMRSVRMQMRFSKENILGSGGPATAMQIQPYTSEGKDSAGAGTVVTGYWNSTYNAVDFVNSSRFCTADVTWAAGNFELVGVEFSAPGRP